VSSCWRWTGCAACRSQPDVHGRLSSPHPSPPGPAAAWVGDAGAPIGARSSATASHHAGCWPPVAPSRLQPSPRTPKSRPKKQTRWIPAKTERTTVTFAASLENLANVYVATFNPEHERWNTYPDQARRAIEVFNLFNIRPMRPLILATAAKMREKEAAESFRFLVGLSVRLLIASTTRSGTVETLLADASKEVMNGVINSVAELRKYLSGLTPSDTQFREAFETTRVSNARIVRYYLRSLEMTAQNEREPWFMPQSDRQVINLEHVLPKKPQGNWPQFSDEDLPSYTTRLGNLALMRASENSELRSEAFQDKKAVYARSPYILTSQLATVEEWTPNAIIERQARLAELAVKTWPAA
jgi:hypothetical protein